MQVGAALRYCSNGCLFAMGFTGSYSTWIVIHTLAAPPNSMICLWRSRPQSSQSQQSAWSSSGTALGRGKYCIWRKELTGAPTGWPNCQYTWRIGSCRWRSVRIPGMVFWPGIYNWCKTGVGLLCKCSMRFIYKLIISDGSHFSSDGWLLNFGIMARSCANRWSIYWIKLSI